MIMLSSLKSISYREMSKACCQIFGLAVFASVWLSPPAGGQTPGRENAGPLPSDAEIREIISQRVDTIAGTSDGIGIVVGAIGPEGRRIVSYGHAGAGDPRPLDGNSCFEIASVTKLFTALLLAQMVREGEVALTDPVEKYLPAGVRIPDRNGKKITLLDLATHTSSLPFMPDQLPPLGDSTTSAKSSAQLYKFLAGYSLKRDIGREWDYSNLGYWLLGEALAFRAGVNFEQLLRARVIAPLNLQNTGLTLTPDMQSRLVVGHDAVLQPSQYFASIPVYSLMPAAGGLVSSANDLLNFLSAVMSLEPSPLAPAMAATIHTRRPKGNAGEEQALGWIVLKKGDDEIYYHDGGSLGFSSSVAWDPKQRGAVVVLSNQMAGVNDIALHLLRKEIPLQKQSPAKRNEIALDPASLASYEGRYEADGEGVFEIEEESGLLTFRAPADWGLPKLRLHAESQNDFFAAELPLRITFQADAAGGITQALIHPPRGQKALLARKIR
jgi:CubicO group peptidase (beta-lactamase class C family)